MTDLNPNTSITTFSVSDQRQRLSDWIKKKSKTQVYSIYSTLNIKTQTG